VFLSLPEMLMLVNNDNEIQNQKIKIIKTTQKRNQKSTIDGAE
jgi:hypothetical protein